MACLQSVDYGRQFVAKTPFACSKIEVLSEERITKGQIRKFESIRNRKKGKSRDCHKNGNRTPKRWAVLKRNYQTGT